MIGDSVDALSKEHPNVVHVEPAPIRIGDAAVGSVVRAILVYREGRKSSA